MWKLSALLTAFGLGVLCAGTPTLAADAVQVRDADDPSAQWTECGDPWPKGCEFLGLWGDPEKTPIGSYVRAPKGYEFIKHSHPSTEHILVIKGVVKSGIVGGPEAVAQPGQYIAFGPDVPHWARCDQACLMYIVYDKPPYGVKFH